MYIQAFRHFTDAVEAPECVCGSVPSAGSRIHHAPVIHMVIVRGPARAQTHISSPVPQSSSHCQPGEECREERRMEGNAICLFACLLLFYLGVFADHSSDWPRNVTVLCRAELSPDSAMEASDFL